VAVGTSTGTCFWPLRPPSFAQKDAGKDYTGAATSLGVICIPTVAAWPEPVSLGAAGSVGCVGPARRSLRLAGIHGSMASSTVYAPGGMIPILRTCLGVAGAMHRATALRQHSGARHVDEPRGEKLFSAAHATHAAGQCTRRIGWSRARALRPRPHWDLRHPSIRWMRSAGSAFWLSPCRFIAWPRLSTKLFSQPHPGRERSLPAARTAGQPPVPLIGVCARSTSS